MGSRVFIVQRPSFYDRNKKGWVNKYDFSAARAHGEFVVLLSPGNVFGERFPEALAALRDGLRDYDPESDHILAAGDPVAIAAAVLLAARNGAVSLLRYDRRDDAYVPYRVATNDGVPIQDTMVST